MMPCGTRKNRRFEAPRSRWHHAKKIARYNRELLEKYSTKAVAGYRLQVGDRFVHEGDVHTVIEVTGPKGRIKATITTNKGATISFRSRLSPVSKILDAESFSAEQKLKRESCCCGATKSNPCACMIQGVMQCDATCPCSLAKKGAESFAAPNHISESDLDDMLYSDEQGVWYKEIIYRVGDNQYTAMYFLYNEDLEYVGKSQFDISADTITVSNITIKDQYKRKNYATVLIKDVMEYWDDEPRKLDFSDAVTEEGRAFIEGWEAESFSAESCPSLEANNENHDWVVMQDYVMVERPESPSAPKVIVMAQIECMHCGKTYDTSKSWNVERKEPMRAESFEAPIGVQCPNCKGDMMREGCIHREFHPLTIERGFPRSGQGRTYGAEECDHNWRIDDIDFTSGYGDPPEVEAAATVTCGICEKKYQTSTSWYPDPVELVRDAESVGAEGKCYKCGVSEKKQKLWWAGKKGLVCGICSEGGVKYRAEEEDSNLTKKEVKMNLWYPLTVGFLGGTISTIAANMISLKWAKKNGHL